MVVAKSPNSLEWIAVTAIMHGPCIM